jgi:hypothetical protein
MRAIIGDHRGRKLYCLPFSVWELGILYTLEIGREGLIAHNYAVENYFSLLGIAQLTISSSVCYSYLNIRNPGYLSA